MRTPALALSVSLSLALAPVLSSQVAPDVAARIKAEGLENSHVMQLLDELTNDIGHRLTGSDNYTRACLWAKAKFEEWGLENVQLEKWDTWPVVWNRGQWQGRVVEPLQIDLHVATQAWTAGTKGRVRARILLAPKNQDQLDAIKDEIEGAYLFREGGGRRRGRRRGGNGEDSSFRQTLAAFVAEHPIAGWVQASSGDAKYPNRIRVFGSRARSTDNLPTVPSITVRNDQARQLKKLIQETGEVIVEFDIRNRFRREPIDVHNVIAEIPGTEKPEEVVVVCGHLDSWHQATGTTDNGTGTTSTMETARILAAIGAKPRRTIRFCLWGGEEQGLLGSQKHTTMRRQELDNVSAVFNHDTGTNWAQSLTVTDAMYDDMARVVKPVMSLTPPDPDFDGEVFNLRKSARMGGGGGSDHASFLRAGVPGFSWRLTGRSDYFGYTWHSQWDTFDVAIPEYQRHNATVFALVALGTANLDDKLSREGVSRARGTDMSAVIEGIFAIDLTGEGNLTVGAVEAEGRGAGMGLKKGDRIVGVNGEKITSLVDLRRGMRGGDANTKRTMTVKRGDEEVVLDLPSMRRR